MKIKFLYERQEQNQYANDVAAVSIEIGIIVSCGMIVLLFNPLRIPQGKKIFNSFRWEKYSHTRVLFFLLLLSTVTKNAFRNPSFCFN